MLACARRIHYIYAKLHNTINLIVVNHALRSEIQASIEDHHLPRSEGNSIYLKEYR